MKRITVTLIMFLFITFPTQFVYSETLPEGVSFSPFEFCVDYIANNLHLERPIFEDQEKVMEELKKNFDIQEEDKAFIFSMRASRLSYDGTDILSRPDILRHLVSVYFEAKEEWGKPIRGEFYDFFRTYVSKRISKTEISIENYFQIEQAKKRFVLP